MTGVERTLAVLFADVSGSTKLYERLGDTEAMRAVDRVIKRMERAIQGFNGRLVKTIGDEVMATFPTASDALQSAMEMQQRVNDLPAVSGVKLAIRVGFHYGPAIEDNNDVFGDTVNTAARIVGLANAGQIFTSRRTVEELPPLLREATRDLDQILVKGKAEGVHAYEVLWQGDADGDMTMKAASITSTMNKSGVSLSLHYKGRSLLLDDKLQSVSLGRDVNNDIVVEDRKASRNHARIERRGQKFYLVDQSSNGTYLSPVGEKELLLRREEVLLQGSGSLCFGSSISEPNVDYLKYEHIQTS